MRAIIPTYGLGIDLVGTGLPNNSLTVGDASQVDGNGQRDSQGLRQIRMLYPTFRNSWTGFSGIILSGIGLTASA